MAQPRGTAPPRPNGSAFGVAVPCGILPDIGSMASPNEPAQ